ncbi:nitrile hydratase subunit beta [Aestuariivirga sp.]|uniref:nitrile hydratase subunit beta n=1 Tax=Aestuariivirga sp. TaxID=2650926 RepID=UPI003918CB4B
MNGAHDCGGMMGFGPVRPEKDEPVFHAPWESRMFALMAAVGDVGGWTLDEDRSACESMHPGHYIASSYYEHWLNGIEILLPRHGLATAAEIASGKASAPAKPVTPTAPEAVWPAVSAPGSYRRDVPAAPAFKIGDRVRARNMNPHGHTRLPRYLRGHAGEIVAWHGAHVFPDANAHGRGEDPRHLYTVRFSAAEVWGSPSRDAIHADLWEPYLEAR